MSDIKLLPCPFCGGSNLRFHYADIEGWIAHVECTNCDDMIGPMSKYKYDEKSEASADAAEVWNRRPSSVDESRLAEARAEALEEAAKTATTCINPADRCKCSTAYEIAYAIRALKSGGVNG